MNFWNDFLNFVFNTALPNSFNWLVFLSVVWLPFVLIPLVWEMWVRYAHFSWHMSRKYSLLEVKLPTETNKSPAAMELVLNALIQTGGEGTPYERYWLGKTRPWASLELCVINGEVRFYIWCFEGQKNFLMANIYAQYPDVAIHDADDYTKVIAENRDKYDIWTCQYEFVKPNPYPIKTYVDYGLSEDPDEEFKVDPLVSLIEILGTVNKEDQIWFQFISRAHKAESGLFNQKIPDKWIDEAKSEIQKIIDEASVERDGQLVPSQAKMTTEKKDLIDALARSTAKFPLDVGIRCIQAYPKGQKNHIRVDVIKGAFRQFGSNNLNNIKPNDQDYSYYWQDPATYFPFLQKILTPRNARLAEHLFRCYQLRSCFFYPYQRGPHIPFLPWGTAANALPILVMNTEELATLYHFPGSTSRAPALKRIPSKRAEAPANLPV
ncbi:MAG TPA: hypothetical protein VJH25_00505 [Candidatus Paceibacterota bacterium]